MPLVQPHDPILETTKHQMQENEAGKEHPGSTGILSPLEVTGANRQDNEREHQSNDRGLCRSVFWREAEMQKTESGILQLLFPARLGAQLIKDRPSARHAFMACAGDEITKKAKPNSSRDNRPEPKIVQSILEPEPHQHKEERQEYTTPIGIAQAQGNAWVNGIALGGREIVRLRIHLAATGDGAQHESGVHHDNAMPYEHPNQNDCVDVKPGAPDSIFDDRASLIRDQECQAQEE